MWVKRVDGNDDRVAKYLEVLRQYMQELECLVYLCVQLT